MAPVSKSSKSRDRRAVVEEMRRQEKAAERRRTLLVLGASVVVAALIIGAATWSYLGRRADAERALTSIGASAAEAGCQEVQTTPAVGNADHRPEGEDIAYPESPPAAGPHWGQFLLATEIRKFYTADDRPAVERLVHSLEHGHTILWYDETIAADEQALADVEAIAKTFSGTGQEDKFIAAPWTAEDGEAFPEDTHIALTHWSVAGEDGQQSVHQYCTGVSGEAVANFVAEYPAADSPEPNAP